MLIVSPEADNSYLVGHLYITGDVYERKKEHILKNRLGVSVIQRSFSPNPVLF